MFAPTVTKAPAGSTVDFATSSESPIPTRNVPLITMRYSSVGWKCGWMRVPAGSSSRTVNVPG